jgi:hypothetical protein
MPSNQPETPTPDALDAAVEEAMWQVVRQYPASYDGDLVYALIAAVEARAVARERARECAWRYVEEDIGLWGGACGTEWQFLADGPADNKMNHCPQCGGRVRVVES